jgi:ATP-dependent phosphofructokinase / diphosphate-dependent phosphofructokinase
VCVVHIGVLTGGGDCPGLNAVIRAVVLSGRQRHGDQVTGFLDGWRGVMEGRSLRLEPEHCRDILALGGTILGTSRTNPFATADGPERVTATIDSMGVDALVVVGGEDTLGVSHQLSERGVKAVGVPKTIDNDLSGTDVTFGFDTAVQIATDAIDRLRTTAESHHRIMVCEVMGRHAGWIAAYAGLAGGAAEILVPEVPFDLDSLCHKLAARHDRGQFSSIVVVSEGALPNDGAEAASARRAGSSTVRDQFGHARLGGIGAWLAGELQRRTGHETRVTALGHLQRGGTPTAFDRILATRFGVAAVEAVHDGHFGTMVALRGGQIVRVSLAIVGTPKTLDLSLLDGAGSAFLD